MRRLFVSSILLIFTLNSAADSKINRAEALKSISMCVISSLLLSSLGPTSPDLNAFHKWSLHPDQDIGTFGLEVFGNGAKEILRKEGGISDSVILERIRWGLQEKIWKLIEPGNEMTGAVESKITVAIWLDKDRYVYFSPTFRLKPLSRKTHNARTVGKIEYVSRSQVITYRLGPAPRAADSTIVLGPEVRSARLPGGP